MRVEVRNQGFAVPYLENVPKWIPQGDSVVLSKEWFKYHKDTKSLLALKKDQTGLPPGIHEARLVFQKYDVNLRQWVEIESPREVNDQRDFWRLIFIEKE